MPQLRVAGVFSTEKKRGELCRALWPCGTHHSPRAPPQPSFAWPAWHDARRIEFPVAPNTQICPPFSPTNSWGRPNPASSPPRPFPPHSDPPALPIHIYEPSTLRHAPAIKPSQKHHVKLSNRSLFHPRFGANGETTFQVPRQSFRFPDEAMASGPSRGASGSSVELRRARSSQAKLRRASAQGR